MHEESTYASPGRSDAISVVLSLGFFITAILQGAIPVVGTELRDEFGLTAARIGLLMSAFLVTYAVTQTPAGVLATRSPLAVISAGYAAMVLGSLLFATSHSYLWMLVARLVQGVGCGTMLPSAGVILVRRLPPRRLGRGWAIYGAASSVGYLVLLLGLARVVEWGGTGLFFVVAAGIAASAGVVSHAGRGLLAGEGVEAPPAGQSTVLGDMRLLMRSRVMTLLGLVNVAGIAISVGVVTWTPAYLQDEFGETLATASALTAGLAVAQIAGAPLAAYLLVRLGHLPLLVGVFCGMTVALFALPLVADLAGTFGVVLAIGLGTALAFAPSFSIIPALVDSRLVGMAGGYLNAFGFVGALFAPWLFGVLLDSGRGYAAGYLMLACFGVGGIAAVSALAASLRKRPKRVGALH
jgi:MFS family permease